MCPTHQLTTKEEQRLDHLSKERGGGGVGARGLFGTGGRGVLGAERSGEGEEGWVLDAGLPLAQGQVKPQD